MKTNVQKRLLYVTESGWNHVHAVHKYRGKRIAMIKRRYAVADHNKVAGAELQPSLLLHVQVSINTLYVPVLMVQ